MFDIGLQELVLIFVIALLVFGPKNLPQLGRSLGRAMREFRRASDEFRSTIETNLQINEPDAPPAPVIEPTPTADTPDTPIEEPAGLAADASAEPLAPADDQAESVPGEPYCARRGARLFHRSECPWVRPVPEADRVYFKKVADAREGGLVVCPSCDPWEPT